LPAHSDLIELGHQQAAEKIGIFLTDQSLGEFGKEDPTIIHHRRKIEAILFLRDDVADNLRTQECIEPGQYRPLRFPYKQRKLLPPVVDNFGVADSCKELRSELRLYQESAEIRKRSTLFTLQEGKHCVTENR